MLLFSSILSQTFSAFTLPTFHDFSFEEYRKCCTTVLPHRGVTDTGEIT